MGKAIKSRSEKTRVGSAPKPASGRAGKKRATDTNSRRLCQHTPAIETMGAGACNKGNKAYQHIDKRHFNIAFAVVLFIWVGSLLYLLATGYAAYSAKREMLSDGERIAANLINNNGVSITGGASAVEGQLDKDQLLRLTELDYNQLKSQLGIENDFAIVLLDDNGNIIPIDGKMCIGKPGASVLGVKCE
ncbi:TPA: hypothetical protein HA317_00330 [Candidatus Woesearchaeota archaeon]|nr:hypothetical protein [Candidatus Woesearchaeota archaeon]